MHALTTRQYNMHNLRIYSNYVTKFNIAAEEKFTLEWEG